MARHKAAPEDYPYGSRPRSAFQRWEDYRTLCIPRLCMYAYACPHKRLKQGYVRVTDCFRRRPEAERPPAALSPYAQAALERLRQEAASSSPAS